MHSRRYRNAFYLLLTPYCLLLTTCSLLLVSQPACKNSIVPPNGLIVPPDTTSHEFMWQIDTIGAQGVLYDVAIVNDTLIYAVGEIFLRDSTGQIDPTAYNLAKWNGETWDLDRVSLQLHNFDCTLAGAYIGRMSAVFAFGDGNVIFTDGADVVKWDGTTYSHLPCSAPTRNGGITKFWGISANDFYAVGSIGTVVHFDGTSWQKIESRNLSTEFRFTDIWGLPDGSRVLCVGSDFLFLGDRALMSLTSGRAQDTLNWEFQATPNSVWFSETGPYYVAGSGIWMYDKLWSRIDSSGLYNRVRGNSTNDVFVWGKSMLHFNGSSWREYPELKIGFRTGLAVKDNVVVVTGFVGDLPFIARGYR